MGAAITYRGFRGRLIDANRHCGRCRYDLSGHRRQTARCPECGSNLCLPGMVRRSVRRPQKRLISLGLALIIFNVGGLAGCWKLGELRSARASQAAAPRRATGRWINTATLPTDPWVYSESGRDGEVETSQASPEPNERSHQPARIEFQFVDRTIQLPPRRRVPIHPANTAISGYGRHVWSGIPSAMALQRRLWNSTPSNNAFDFDPGLLNAPPRFIDLSGRRVETLFDTPPVHESKGSPTRPDRDIPSK